MGFRGDKTELTEKQVAVLVAPLAAVCAGQIGSAAIKVYHSVWKSTEERWLRAAIERYLATTTERWAPMPAAILDLARSLKAADRRWRIQTAAPCSICRSSEDGLVDAIDRETGRRRNGLACLCVRGEGAREAGRDVFDPAAMVTCHEWFGRALLGAPAAVQIRIPDLSVPAPAVAAKRDQLRAMKAKG